MRVTSAALALVLASFGANAQSMSPMRGEITSFENSFAVRVYPGNPYGHRIRVEVKVYDQHFVPIEAEILPPSVLLGADSSRPVLVVVPFAGSKQRKVRICTESIPFPGQGTQIRAQICGRFLARRL